jgi:3-phosphoshikimate 1-carboxyvinyltransferase
MDSLWDFLEEGEALKNHDEQEAWPIIKGPINWSRLKKIECDISKTTQVASAILMVSLVSNQDVEFSFFPDSAGSQGYLKMTEQLVNRFKTGERCFRAPLDFSSLGYLLAYGAVVAPVTISGVLFIDKFQADAKLIAILQEVGADIKLGCNGLKVRPAALEGFELDCREFPDLVPTLLFIAAYATSESSFSHLQNLRLKESDRLYESLRILDLFQVQHSYNEQEDRLSIFPKQERTEKEVFYHTVDDHRMALMALLFMLKEQGGEIEGFECVRKSFPLE